MACFFKTFLVFVAALSISFDLGGFGGDFERVLGRFWGDLARILGRFEDWGLRFSAMRPLRFCMPRRLGFWGYEQETAATKTKTSILSC